MNQKATVSKELNQKHTKILESLLKFPENWECADCKTRAPRWASVNLGIFICMQCSGIHRSLGVHISKVRSATLDTWLPEQVSFIQSMGNEKSNSYWEAELPPNYDRVGIENFIRAKYQDKRWVPRNGKTLSPSRPPPRNNGRSYAKKTNDDSDERKVITCHSVATNIPRISDRSQSPNITKPVPVKASLEVSLDQRWQDFGENPNPAVSKTELVKHEASTTQVVSTGELPKQDTITTQAGPPPKVDYATELFNLLSMGNSKENGSATWADDNTRTDFQSAEAKSTPETSGDSSIQPKSGIKELFLSSTLLAPYSPAKSIGGFQTTAPSKLNQSVYHGVQSHMQNLANVGNQVSRTITHVAGPHMNAQVGHNKQTRPIGNSFVFPNSSMYAARPMAPVNGVSNVRAYPLRPALPKSGYDYDFSSLTQGMFMKR